MDYFEDVCISFLDEDSIQYTFSMEGQVFAFSSLAHKILLFYQSAF